MAKIHTPGSGYVAPLPVSGWKWLPYADADKKRVVERALFILRNNVRGMKPCNDCFSALPGGLTFDDILDDPDIVISYDPGNVQGRYGVTRRAGAKDVSITEWAIRMGRWTVASTLVHEFAHVNGAPGATAQAEATLPCCGFSAHYDRTIIGAVGGSSSSAYA